MRIGENPELEVAAEKVLAEEEQAADEESRQRLPAGTHVLWMSLYRDLHPVPSTSKALNAAA